MHLAAIVDRNILTNDEAFVSEVITDFVGQAGFVVIVESPATARPMNEMTMLVLLVLWTVGVRIPPWAVPLAGVTALVWTVVLQDLGLWMPPLGPLLAITAAAAFVTRVAPRIT